MPCFQYFPVINNLVIHDFMHMLLYIYMDMPQFSSLFKKYLYANYFIELHWTFGEWGNGIHLAEPANLFIRCCSWTSSWLILWQTFRYWSCFIFATYIELSVCLTQCASSEMKTKSLPFRNWQSIPKFVTWLKFESPGELLKCTDPRCPF